MRSAALDEIRRTADLLKIVEQDVPALAGRFNGRYTPEVPCPRCGGTTRFSVSVDGNGVMRVFCRHCAIKGLDAVDYIMWREDGITGFKEAVKWWQDGSKLTRNTFSGKSLEPPKPLDMTITDTHHAALGPHNAYYRSRGISDELIEKHKLGWNAQVEPLRHPLHRRREPVGHPVPDQARAGEGAEGGREEVLQVPQRERRPQQAAVQR